MYRVISDFTDLKDHNHKYHAGDEFPRQGLKVDDVRLAKLASANNKRHMPLIVKVEEAKVETDRAVETEPQKPKKKGKKKDADGDMPRDQKLV